MDKKAYYAEYPDKGIASIVKVDDEGEQIWTAIKPDSDALIAYLQDAGYEVVAFVSAAYEDKKSGRSRRKWHGIDVDGEKVQTFRNSFASMTKPKSQDEPSWQGFRLDLLPS